MYLTVLHLAYTYPGTEAPALLDASVTFAPGWTGVVGPNGAGKSTLLKLACGILSPDSGNVSPKVDGAFCVQSTETAPTSLEEFACDYRPETIKLRCLLEIDDAWLWRYDTLSQGERKRIQIACALAGDPAVLALDEPTNHLDAGTRELVARTLASYRGIGLLVSHDRALLDELVHSCVFLDQGSATVVPGTYTQAKEQMDLRSRTVADERRTARHDLSRLKGESARRNGVAAQSATRRSARHLNPRDHDGREKIRLAVVSGQDGKTGKLSSQMTKKIERAEKRVAETKVAKTYGGSLALDAFPAKRKVLAQLPAGTITLGEERLLHHPNLLLGNEDRIGLWGGNGTGKSTLLSALMARVSLDEGVVFLPQEITEDEGKEVLAQVRALAPAERGRLLAIAARLDSPPARILQGDSLSPGELRKLMLAQGLLSSPRLIVMDEPTNHLDIRSIEAVQEVLASCECALVLVSHDAPFLDALTTTRWLFEAERSEREGMGDTQVRIVLSSHA